MQHAPAILRPVLAGDDDLQLLWLRAAGEDAFSAGSAVQDHAPERARAMLTTFHRALRTLRRLPAVTIAVVRGHCLGGGLELAMSADVIALAVNRFVRRTAVRKSGDDLSDSCSRAVSRY